MDIYRIKHTSSTDVLKGNTLVVSNSAWDAVDVYIKSTHIPCELGDKFKVTLPDGLALDSGWKVSEDYKNEYEDQTQHDMFFSVGVYYTTKGGETVVLFLPGNKWVKLNERDIDASDLVVLWA